MAHFSVKKSITGIFNIRPTPVQAKVIFDIRQGPSFVQRANFSASLPLQKKKKIPRENDSRTRLIRYFLKHPLTPRPLRFSRHRALRHWTIHRAAQLVLHKSRQERERDLERQYNSMRNACEELRLGSGDGGRLYRQAITKKGVYGGFKMEQELAIVGNGGVPLEYARAQTESPPIAGFNEAWQRQ